MKILNLGHNLNGIFILEQSLFISSEKKMHTKGGIILCSIFLP